MYIFKLRYFCENNTRYFKKRYKSSVLLIFLLTYSTAQNMFCEKQECFWITVQLVNTLSYLQACRSAQSCQLVGENAVHSLPKLTVDFYPLVAYYTELRILWTGSFCIFSFCFYSYLAISERLMVGWSTGTMLSIVILTIRDLGWKGGDFCFWLFGLWPE